MAISVVGLIVISSVIPSSLERFLPSATSSMAFIKHPRNALPIRLEHELPRTSLTVSPSRHEVNMKGEHCEMENPLEHQRPNAAVFRANIQTRGALW